MAAGYFDFTAGSTLTAANLEDYCELQGIMRFASAAARTTALSGVLTEGLMCYLVDLNVIQVYSGSAWSTIGPVHGALTSWTPVVVQGATPTLTVTSAAYTRVGRWVSAYCTLAITSAGTSSNTITVSLPVTAATSNSVIGNGYVLDASTGFIHFGMAVQNSTTTAVFYAVTGVAPSATIVGSGAQTMQTALANGDTVAMQVQYQAAADA